MSPVAVMWVVTATLLVMLWFGRQHKFSESPLHPMIIGWLAIITCVTAVCAVVVTVRAQVTEVELSEAVALHASSYDGSLDEADVEWITRAAAQDLGKELDWENVTDDVNREPDSTTAYYEVVVGRFALDDEGYGGPRVCVSIDSRQISSEEPGLQRTQVGIDSGSCAD